MDYSHTGRVTRWTPSKFDDEYEIQASKHIQKAQYPIGELIMEKAKLWWYRFEVSSPLYVMDHEERLFFLAFMGIVLVLSVWASSTVIGYCWRSLMSLLGTKDAWDIATTPKVVQQAGIEIMRSADQVYGNGLTGQVIANST